MTDPNARVEALEREVASLHATIAALQAELRSRDVKPKDNDPRFFGGAFGHSGGGGAFGHSDRLTRPHNRNTAPPHTTHTTATRSNGNGQPPSMVLYLFSSLAE